MNCSFLVSAQYLSLLLNDIKHSQSGSYIFSWVYPVLLSELITQNVNKQVVEISSSEVSVAVVDNDLHLAFQERGNSDGELAVAQVNEGDIPGFLFVKIWSSEEPVVESDSCALVDESQALELGDLSSIENCLSFSVAVVRRHRNNDFVGHDVSIFVELLHFLEVRSQNLLRSEDLQSAADVHLKAYLFVLKRDYLIGDEFFLLLDLVQAVSVQTHEAREEL